MNRFKCVGLVSLIFIMAGCAAMKKNMVFVHEGALKNFEADPERALVYIYRDKAFLGKGIVSQLVVNNVATVKVDQNQFSVVSVAPGEYDVFSNSADETNLINMAVHNRKKDALPINAAAGKIYCFETSFSPLKGFTLKAVAQEELQPKIKKAKFNAFQKFGAGYNPDFSEE